MKCTEVMVVNKLGLHARAAAKFVSLAAEFGAEISLAREGQQVNGKSIMGVMMLAAAKGSRLTICADGADEGRAVEALARLVRERFGEAE